MKHLPLNPMLFKANRERFVRELAPNSIAIFNSNEEMPSNGDQLYRFWQNSDLYWLTGIEQEDTMVIFYPDNPETAYREVLVLVRPQEMKEKWDGKRLRAEEARAISGMETIVWLDQLPALLQVWIHHAEIIYLNSNENDRKGSAVETRDERYARETMRRYPLHKYERTARVMKKLRAVKTAYEVEVTRQAIDITEKAFRKVLQVIRPGIMEYEVEAEIIYTFLRNRASREAYGSIVASGDRARTLHYVSNNEACRDGELVLMDFGAYYGGYCADLTRTVPVNGKFTTRQKEVYNACLHLHNYAKSILKPGISLTAYTDLVGDEAGKEFVKIGLLNASDLKNEDKNNRAYRKYLYHGISHHLGVDIHDLGPRFAPLQEGMMLTVEPGIYIEAEQMGIRIENNVWLTKDGNEDLTKNIPLTVEDIEALMKQ